MNLPSAKVTRCRALRLSNSVKRHDSANSFFDYLGTVSTGRVASCRSHKQGSQTARSRKDTGGLPGRHVQGCRLELNLLRRHQCVIGLRSRGNGRCSRSSYVEKQLDGANCRSCSRSELPSCGAANASHRRSDPSRRSLPRRAPCARTGASSGEVGCSTWKYRRTSIPLSRVQPLLQRNASLFRDLELNRPAGLVLDNCRTVSHPTPATILSIRKLTRSPGLQLCV
jgi:hypothetical protein